MAKWIPPIPAGALCSPDAIAINTALPLLGWCYDQVGRDGWLEMNLRTVAVDINVEYWTIKRWWAALKSSSFIAEFEEHGRGGMRVRLADEWIDWRQIKARETGSNMRPITDAGYENGTETGANILPNTANRDRNGTETGAEMIPNVSAYKVLISTDQAESERELEDRDGTARSLAHPAMKTLAKYFPKLELDAKQIRSICSTATDGTVWRSVVELFADNGWQPLVGNLLDRYRKTLKEHSQSNGKAERVAPTVGLTNRPQPPPDAQPAQQTAARMKALLERNRDNNVP